MPLSRGEFNERGVCNRGLVFMSSSSVNSNDTILGNNIGNSWGILERIYIPPMAYGSIYLKISF